MRVSGTVTSQVRFVTDTCSTLDDEALITYLRGEPGGELARSWFYEFEVFARLGRGRLGGGRCSASDTREGSVAWMLGYGSPGGGEFDRSLREERW